MAVLKAFFCVLWMVAVIGAPDYCPDTCAVTNSYCDTGESCGFVSIKSRAGFVTKFCINGQNTSDKKNPSSFCCNSDTFTSGYTRTLKLPCDSSSLIMQAEDEVQINKWSSVAVIKYNDSSVTACYEMSGSTTKPTTSMDVVTKVSYTELALSGSHNLIPLAGSSNIRHLQTVKQIEQQTSVPIEVQEHNTIWHHVLGCCCKRDGKKYASKILKGAQSTTGVILAIVLELLYMVGLYIFDRGLFGNFSVIYSTVVLSVTLPGSILYFGTINVGVLCLLLKDFTVWFKMHSVVLSNAMRFYWAYHNLSFDQMFISVPHWVCIYAVYFFVNLLTTSMACLLDGFKWARWLKVLGPVALALYFTNSWRYWHLSQDDTKISLKVRSYKKEYGLAGVAEGASSTAAAFFWAQAYSAFRNHDQTTVLSCQVTLNWT